MSLLLKPLLACAAAISLAAAAAWGAVEINDLQVTNVGTTTFTAVWTTSEVSTPGLEVFTDSGGTSAVTATLGFDYYPIAEGDPAVVNESGARAGRRALELLAINRRVVVVRVTGLAPGTVYYVRPRTFGPGATDNSASAVALKQVTTALFTSMVVDGRLLRVRFPLFAGEGMVALVEGPAGTTPLSAIIGDSTEADSAIFPLAGLLDTTSGTNALFGATQQVVIRMLGSGAPIGTFTRTIDFAPTFRTAQLDTLVSDLASPSPIFTAHPVNQAVSVGATATFAVTATGTPAPTFQWQRQPAAGGTWSDLVNNATYSGATTATLTVGSATLPMSGDRFRCVATNGVPPDATSNAATLTVTLVPIAPSITTQPVGEVVMIGGTATFTVAATNPGSGVLAYRWYFTPAGGSTPQALADQAGKLAGTQTASLTVSNVQISDTGDYVCVVSSSDGQATSGAAPLCTAPRIVRLISQTAIPGAQVVVPILLLAAGDENSVTFGLQFNPAKLTYVGHAPGTDVAGGTITPNVTQKDNGQLGFLIGREAGTVHAAGTRSLIKLTFAVAAGVAVDEALPLTFVDQPSPRRIFASNSAQLPGVFADGRVTAIIGLEGDVNGDGDVDGGDWVKLGRMVVGLDPLPVAGVTYLRTDCAPRATKGDGTVDGGDWVQVGRFVVGLDAPQPAGGPSALIP